MKYKVGLKVDVRIPSGRDMVEDIVQSMSSSVINELTRQFARTLVAFSGLSGGSVQSDVSDSVISVFIEDRKYAWVSFGTNVGKEPYTIAASPGKTLRIRGYNPGSQVGIMDTAQPRYTGNDRFARSVQHPGIEPREFDIQIREELLEYLKTSSGKNALSKAIDDSLGSGRNLSVNLRFE